MAMSMPQLKNIDFENRSKIKPIEPSYSEDEDELNK